MIFWYRTLPRKLLRALSELNVSCFTKYLKMSDRICRFFCAYLHGMYDFTRLTRAIVCGEIDLRGDRFVEILKVDFAEEFQKKKS